DLDAANAVEASLFNRVLDQRGGDALTPPLRVGEQILQLIHAVDEEGGGKPDDRPVIRRRYSRLFFATEGLGNDRLPTRGEDRVRVAFVRKRGPPVDVAQAGCIRRPSGANRQAQHGSTLVHCRSVATTARGALASAPLRRCVMTWYKAS